VHEATPLPDARQFMLWHVDLLSERPVWLFSSGPLGPSLHDGPGRDLMDLDRPRLTPGVATSPTGWGDRSGGAR